MDVFFIEDDGLLENNNTIWYKVSADIQKEFDSNLPIIENFKITKTKFHGNEVTDFYDKKIPKLKTLIILV